MRSKDGAASPKLFTLMLLLCASCGACVPTSGSQTGRPEPLPRAPLPGAEMVKGYKGWTRVNPQPTLLHLRRATDCALPPDERPGTAGEENPHRDNFVTVYVNDAGRRAMLKEKWPRFPLGSLIVKEKLPVRDANAAPELLTVMLKREAGYDPEGGDWEYLVLDGRGEEVRARGKLESCRACHQEYPHTDFVSRKYLPYDLYRKLK